MSGRKPGTYSRGNVRSPPYGRKPSSGTPPGFFALGPWCDVCCKLLVIILFFVSVFTVISTAWDWGTSLLDGSVDGAAVSSSYEKITALFDSPVRVDTGKSTSGKKESGWGSSGWESTPKEPTTQKPKIPSEPAIPHTTPHSQTTDPLSHHGPTPLDLSAPIPKITDLTTHHGPTPQIPLLPANTLLPALQKHCNYFPPLLSVSPSQLHLSSLFPIDGLPMSNDHDIFAHLINTGLTLYRAPIFNLPLIRSRLLPQARVIASLLDSQILRKNLASSVEGKREVDEAKRALEEFMNSFPGARFGGKVQRVDGVLERELEGLKVLMGGNGDAGGKRGWISTVFRNGHSNQHKEQEIRNEALKVLKRIYEIADFYHTLLTTTITKHEAFLRHGTAYLQFIHAVRVSGKAVQPYTYDEQGVNAFWELSESMMAGLRARERRLRQVLEEREGVLERFGKRMEGGGREARCEVVSLRNLIGWVQHSFMVERRYDEGFF